MPIWRQNTLIFRSARKFLSFLRSKSWFREKILHKIALNLEIVGFLKKINILSFETNFYYGILFMSSSVRSKFHLRNEICLKNSLLRFVWFHSMINYF
ncbi:hypothetical protein LEP1GSC056_1787 [Leptospira borgpetersenii str. Brem 328]|uniref:Uncharacterized protein n=1 Tax=Leptospira borgpetersenii str. Brem 328 TaxID=1049780 RepID=A0ABC9SMW6_LEPBO|nr:hypothetical protein LEP1GSC056_1787 [Leptospira borgpetersenii str. Brem 328]